MVPIHLHKASADVENDLSSNSVDNVSARRFAPLSTLVPVTAAIFCVEIPVRIYDLQATLAQNICAELQIFLSAARAILCAAASLVLLFHCISRYQLGEKISTFQSFSIAHWGQIVFCSLFTLGTMLDVLTEAGFTTAGSAGLHDNLSRKDGGVPIMLFYYTLSCMLTPLLLTVIFADALREVLWVSWALCLTSLLAAAAIKQDGAYGLIVGYYFLYALLIFYSMQSNALLAYLMRTVQRRRVQDKLEQQDMNMKHMLANVAHDLKTVSPSTIVNLLAHVASS